MPANKEAEAGGLHKESDGLIEGKVPGEFNGLSDEFPNVMEGDDYRKQNKNDESKRMHRIFDNPNFRGLHSPKGRENRGDEKPASIERGKRQKIECSEINGKERRDRKYYGDADFCRNEFDKESSYCYWPSDSLGRFLTFGRRFWNNELAKDFKKEFKREGYLV